MLQVVVHRRHARRGAVNEWRRAPQQSRGTQPRDQGKGQAEARFVRAQLHRNGVEAVDIACGVVDGGVIGNRVRAAVRQRKKGLVGILVDSRSKSSQQIRRSAVLQVVGESGKVGIVAGTRLG